MIAIKKQMQMITWGFPLAWNLSLSPRPSGWIAAPVTGPGAGKINSNRAHACGDGPTRRLRVSGGRAEAKAAPSGTEIPGDPVPETVYADRVFV